MTMRLEGTNNGSAWRRNQRTKGSELTRENKDMIGLDLSRSLVRKAPKMSIADWFTMVHPSGGIRYEMIDQDDPGSWVVDPASHRATYSGRIMEDHVDSGGLLRSGVLRRCSISFNLPPGVHCGPGFGGAPPPPSSSDEEDPSEEEPVGVHSSESSTPSVAIIDDQGSGPKPVSPASESIAVARGGRIGLVDLVVLDSDSDDDHADT